MQLKKDNAVDNSDINLFFSFENESKIIKII